MVQQVHQDLFVCQGVFQHPFWSSVTTRVEFKWCKSTTRFRPMERKRHLPVKVVNSETKVEENRSSSLEGGRQIRTMRRPTKDPRIQDIESMLVTKMSKGAAYPPHFDAAPSFISRRRFQSGESSAISGTFTTYEGNNQFLLITGSGVNNALSYVDCWRIKAIECWVNNYVDNSTTVTITPAGNTGNNSFVDREAAFSCSSRSEAKPGHMKIKPALTSPMGSWHKTSITQTNLFQIAADYGGASSGNWATITLDIVFEYVLNLIGGPQSYLVSSSNTTVGTLGGGNLALGSSGALKLTNINVLV